MTACRAYVLYQGVDKTVKKKYFKWEIICLSIFILIFNLLFLGDHHLISPDETRYVGISWEMLKANNYLIPTIAGSPFLGKPILFYWLNILAFKLFGVNEFAARFFPAILASITAIFAYFATIIVFNRRVAVLSAILIAITPMFFALGHYANMDGEVASWLNLALFSLMVGLYLKKGEKSRNLWLYLAYIFAAFAFLTKGLIGLFFPAMTLFFWCLILNNWRVLLNIRLISGLILFLIIILPWFFVVEAKYSGFMAYFFIWNQFVRYLGSDFNQHKPLYFYVPLVIGGVFPFTIYFFQTQIFHIKNFLKNKKEHQSSLLLWLWVILIFIFFSIPKSKLPGYIGPVFPALAVLMAVYLDKIWQKKLSKINQWVTFCFALLIILVAITLVVLPFIFHTQAAFLNTAPYGRFLAFIFFIGGLYILFNLKKKAAAKRIIITLIVMNILMNLTLIASLKYFNLQLNFPIAAKVTPYLKENPKIKVLMLGRYYYSVPLYLDQDIPIVTDWDQGEKLGDNWKREIYEGVHYLKHLPKDLVTYQKFSQIWQQANKNKETLIIISSDNPKDVSFQNYIGHTAYKLLATVPRRGVFIITNNINLSLLTDSSKNK